MIPSGEVAIVGVAESALGIVADQSVLQMQARAALAALDEAGLEKSDVDGLMVAGPGWHDSKSIVLAEYLGIQPTFSDTTDVGGASFEAHLHHAALAIQAGVCECVLITYASTQRSDQARSLGGRDARWGLQYEIPYGLPQPLGAYALAAQRHMWEYGTLPEQLAEIAVAARSWAQLNPKAYKRDPLSVDDVMESPVIASPLRRFDCCLVTDGGGAVVVTSMERARQLRSRPVSLLGAAETHTHEHIHQMPDLTRSGAVETGARAFGMAGVQPEDIDVAQIYDSFTITVLQCLEDLGFCEKGDGGAFVSGGRIAPGGSFPLNTSGGGLSYCHPGMFGIFLIIEAVRQLRRECGDRQVDDARLALVHGVGNQLSSHSTLILGRE